MTETDHLANATAMLHKALRGVAEPAASSNQVTAAIRRLELSLNGLDPRSATLEAMEADISSALGFLLNLDSQLKDNATASAPTYGRVFGMPTLSRREIARRQDALLRAFKAYRAAREAAAQDPDTTEDQSGEI